jgi:hypothetical protein
MLQIVKNAQSQAAIEYARALLLRCEAGEVIAVTAVEETPDGSYSVKGSTTPNRLTTAGMLLDAAVTRLTTA